MKLRITTTVYFYLVSAFAAVTVIARAFAVPFNHDEAATFFHYIQPGDILPFYSDADANNHFLNTLLSRLGFLAFGDHPFVLRLPNVLAVFVLIAAVYRFMQHLKTDDSKRTLMFFFLVPFFWLAFFGYCRGYGLSMAFFILSLSYFSSYLQTLSDRYFLFFVLYAQLALSSNLILIIPLAGITVVAGIMQILNNWLFTFRNVFLHLINAGLFFFWYSYSIYLKAKGALYYGAGDSYWKVTFLTLSDVLTDINSPVILIVFIAVCLVLSFTVISKTSIKNRDQAFIYLALLILNIVAFYLLKLLLDVNYPEDRTGLFFYVIAALFLSFAIDHIRHRKIALILSFSVCFLTASHSLLNWNLNYNNVPNYELIPRSFYNTLVQEQNERKSVITIGGYRMKELIYDFMNYRNGGNLNLLDPMESMHAYTDFYIGDRQDSSFWKQYYSPVEKDDVYGYVLLKRNKFLERDLLVSSDSVFEYSGNDEYFSLFNIPDISPDKISPILAELKIELKNTPIPFKSWIVMEVRDGKDDKLHYARWPLNWSGYNWNEAGTKTIVLTATYINVKGGKLICYLWNMKKEEFHIRTVSTAIYSLRGEGANAFMPE